MRWKIALSSRLRFQANSACCHQIGETEWGDELPISRSMFSLLSAVTCVIPCDPERIERVTISEEICVRLDVPVILAIQRNKRKEKRDTGGI